MSTRKPQAGFALLTALGLLAVLSLAAVTHWRATASVQEALWLATGESLGTARIEAGSAIVLAGLAARGTAEARAVDDADPPALERRFADGALLRCQVRSLAARLNVNALVDRRGEVGQVARAAFAAVFEAAGIAPAAVDALADRLDADDDERTPWGAEAAWYRAHRPGQAQRSGPMNTLEELADIRGFPPDAAARLGRWLTVLPPAARLDVNRAEPELLTRIDPSFTSARVAALLAARPFPDLPAWQAWADRHGVAPLTGLVDTRSRHQAVDCHYRAPNARLAEALEVEWQEDGSPLFLGRDRLPPEGP